MIGLPESAAFLRYLGELTAMDDFEWNATNEGLLLEAMAGLKPVGIHRHFQMVVIASRLEALLNKTVPSDKIWSHLDTMYNMPALNEMEKLPYSLSTVQDFYLPTEEYGSLMQSCDARERMAEAKRKERELAAMAAAAAAAAAASAAAAAAAAATSSHKKAEEKKKDHLRRDSREGKNGSLSPAVRKESRKEAESRPKAASKAKAAAQSTLDVKRKRSLRGSSRVEEASSTPPPKRRRV